MKVFRLVMSESSAYCHKEAERGEVMTEAVV